MKHMYTFIFFVYVSQTSFSQLAISSQSTLIPTELNPGLTGSACGLRVITHFQNIRYRSNASTFINYGASIDMPI
ncbi:MAG: hypothetical protein IPO92_19545 [Saprospiraceae bacterium]|nr:hypothetical protein [Saprospiraceae bacterium]